MVTTNTFNNFDAGSLIYVTGCHSEVGSTGSAVSPVEKSRLGVTALVQAEVRRVEYVLNVITSGVVICISKRWCMFSWKTLIPLKKTQLLMGVGSRHCRC